MTSTISLLSEMIEGSSRPVAEGVGRGGCRNVLTKDEHSPGGAYCSNTTPVQVEKAWERRK